MSTKYKYMTSRQPHRKPTGYEHWSTEAIQARKRELEAWLLKEFPMPAGETDEDAHIDRVLEQYLKKRPTSATPPAEDAPAPAPTEDGNELLQEVTEFLARYLQCSEHQRTLLALWVLHTYCFCAARVTPYLAIRSADKQSGKTLCLQLLSLLCEDPALTSGGFTARDLALPMKEKPIDALLFDECQLTVGTRARPRSPALRAALAGSFHLGLGHRNIAEERNAFLPKAFASRGPLPEELADRCIPIILEPLFQSGPQPQQRNKSGARPPQKNKSGPQPPVSPTSGGFSRDGVEAPSAASSDNPIERLDLHHVADQIKPLRDRLERWTKNHFNALTNRTLLPRSAFPPNLSPRQQDLCDPLLQIAALVGAPWIAHALEACAIVFDLQSIFELRPNLQLLADVRDCFAHHNWPDRLPTEVLQDWTDSLPPRPWDSEGSMNGYKLARLLSPFEIRPRNQRIGKERPLRGYELENFREAWKHHLSFEVPRSEIANKNGACNTVSQVGKPSTSAQVDVPKVSEPQKNPEWTAAAGVPDASRVCTQRGGGAPGCAFETSTLENGRKKETVASAVTQARSAMPALPSKPAKIAACNTISHAHAVSPKAEISNQESKKPSSQTTNQKSQVPAEETTRTSSPLAGLAARSQQLEAHPREISVDTQHGIHRLKTLHSRLRLQGICPPFEALAASYLPHHLHAALDWVEAHPEWCFNLRYKPALEFVAAFQKTLAVLTMKGA